jgi:hypothetical protein
MAKALVNLNNDTKSGKTTKIKYYSDEIREYSKIK